MSLFEPIQLRNLTLKNRMVMSAMTRSRADVNGLVGDMTVQYYTQRVSAGMIGTLFLANPDLPKRFELDAALNQADRATMFGGGAAGYIDYPLLND